jgi:hypothetical protein
MEGVIATERGEDVEDMDEDAEIRQACFSAPAIDNDYLSNVEDKEGTVPEPATSSDATTSTKSVGDVYATLDLFCSFYARLLNIHLKTIKTSQEEEAHRHARQGKVAYGRANWRFQKIEGARYVELAALV